MPARKVLSTGSIRMGHGPVPNRTLNEYRRESANLMSVNLLDTMAVDNKNINIQ